MPALRRRFAVPCASDCRVDGDVFGVRVLEVVDVDRSSPEIGNVDGLISALIRSNAAGLATTINLLVRSSGISWVRGGGPAGRVPAPGLGARRHARRAPASERGRGIVGDVASRPLARLLRLGLEQLLDLVGDLLRGRVLDLNDADLVAAERESSCSMIFSSRCMFEPRSLMMIVSG